MADQTNQHDHDALLAAALAFFLLTNDDRAAFATAIYDARVQAIDDAITSAGDAIGADTSGYQPPDDVLKAMADASQQNAESIVGTWNTDITAEAERFIAANPSADEAALKADLHGWASYRAQWKSAQIAQYEASSGYSAGVDQFIGDLMAGDLELPDGVALSDIMVTVLPDSASHDLCAEYAGNSYPLDQYGDLPNWPIHVSCPHYNSIDFAS